MSWRLNRPVQVYDPAKGVLYNEHFQIAYVTNDIDRAVAVFRDRFGVPRFRASDAQTPSGATIQVRAAWAGGVAYEIICGSGPGMELYACGAREEGFVLRHHHFGYMVADEAAWAALEHQIAAGGWVVRQRGDHPGFCRTVYVEAPELGHYLEFILPFEQMLARLDATPAD